MRRELIKAAILDVLNDFTSPVPERTIVLSMIVLLRISATYSDLRQLLKTMEEERLVIGTTTDDATVWCISAGGKAYLAERQAGSE